MQDTRSVQVYVDFLFLKLKYYPSPLSPLREEDFDIIEEIKHR